MPSLEESIRDFARAVGFSLVGIAPAVEADGFDRLQEWLARGYSGDMSYMSRQAEARRHPSSILTDVRSVIVVGMDYDECRITRPDQRAVDGREALPANHGKVARYAIGTDYHDAMWRRLDKLLDWLRNEVPACRGRSVVDTAPLLERDFARRAGLGWIGKNTMLINKERGSYIFLGALLTTLDLKPDPPHEAEHCGSCTACLDACPTQAFTGPGWLDARRCISYLTIELRGPVPAEFREDVGSWLFGCDICQEVCPWNRHDETSTAHVDAIELLEMDEAEYRHRFGRTALSRARQRGLRRNAAIVLANTGDQHCLPALSRAANDSDAVVRESAAWAIVRIKEREKS